MTVMVEAKPSGWDVFISHAFEDKEAIARPLADELRARGLRVWYDEFELRVGDSLRASIDHGLANCHYGIVILSPQFFEKRWAAEELNGLTARETADRSRLILPVWHLLDQGDIAAHSPMLADRFAARSDQELPDLVDQLLAAMDERVTASSQSNRRALSLSPPPATVELELIASGARLLDHLIGQHEGVFDVDDIEDEEHRELAVRVLDELQDLADIIGDLGFAQRDAATRRAQDLMVELLEADLLTSVGQYERRLTSKDSSPTLWRGVVVSVAPAAAIAARQRAGQERPSPTSGDQALVDELLGLLTRPSMRLIANEDFAMPWPERLTTPLSFLVHEYDEVEHRFADATLEERRQRLLQAAHHFLHQEAFNGFTSIVPGSRDGGWTPGAAEGDPHRQSVLERRRGILAPAAEDLLSAYDDLVTTASRAGYSIQAMTASRHPRVDEHDRQMRAIYDDDPQGDA
jgi:hypothetical protein